ncbi:MULTISPECIES: DNA primase DnaG [Halorussus]|uniref:DNA primase DnaG n=1 Tax=Halorussus TaxID=1070314 RepID=UPI00209F49BD|nr:DNA primase DnaG [Halorussus vallis]USZ77164.1 DNA primase DnaG [Halorussus vallis]
MDDTAKYVIHADITADGVVERSDVVGAVFGQTEGLLGDDLDLRDLQQSSKLGRIDVDVDSQNGQSYGTITIASSLDKVETSILAAALETISRVGPCRASVAIAGIEDVRAAKRRRVVERAKELISESFDEDVMTSREILEEVRQSVRVEDIVEFEGLPAGPRVADSDAIVVVEGRADVLNLLRYGVKNAIAVEGTNVPDAVAELTQSRNVTAFLDGDRGGDLIRKELSQVGDIDYVAFAPAGKSVEDLDRREVMSALRSKHRFDESMVEDTDAESSEGETDPDASGSADETKANTAATDGSARPAPESETASAGPETTESPERPDSGRSGETTDSTDDGSSEADESEPTETDAAVDSDGRGDPADAVADAERGPQSLRGHVEAVVDGETGTVRLLDSSFGTLAEAAAENAFDAVESAEEVPYAVVLDGTLSQRVLDVAAQRGVEQAVAAELGEFVKQPAGVRIRAADRFER